MLLRAFKKARDESHGGEQNIGGGIDGRSTQRRVGPHLTNLEKCLLYGSQLYYGHLIMYAKRLGSQTRLGSSGR